MQLAAAAFREENGDDPRDDQLAAMDSEPAVDEILRLLIDAWSDMSTERPQGWKTGLIPWSRIRAWCTFYNFDREATGLIIRVIRDVDVKLYDERDLREKAASIRGGRK